MFQNQRDSVAAKQRYILHLERIAADHVVSAKASVGQYVVGYFLFEAHRKARLVNAAVTFWPNQKHAVFPAHLQHLRCFFFGVQVRVVERRHQAWVEGNFKRNDRLFACRWWRVVKSADWD